MNNRSKTHFWLLTFAILAFLGPFGAILTLEAAKKNLGLEQPEQLSIISLPGPEANTAPTEPAPEPEPVVVPVESTPAPSKASVTAPVAKKPAPVVVKKPKSSAKTKTS